MAPKLAIYSLGDDYCDLCAMSLGVHLIRPHENGEKLTVNGHWTGITSPELSSLIASFLRHVCATDEASVDQSISRPVLH